MDPVFGTIGKSGHDGDGDEKNHSQEGHDDDSGGGKRRKPGRPATYVFDKPDEELTEPERRLKTAIIKRRLRQNRSYQKRKQQKTDDTPDSADLQHDDFSHEFSTPAGPAPAIASSSKRPAPVASPPARTQKQPRNAPPAATSPNPLGFAPLSNAFQSPAGSSSKVDVELRTSRARASGTVAGPENIPVAVEFLAPEMMAGLGGSIWRRPAARAVALEAAAAVVQRNAGDGGELWAAAVDPVQTAGSGVERSAHLSEGVRVEFDFEKDSADGSITTEQPEYDEHGNPTSTALVSAMHGRLGEITQMNRNSTLEALLYSELGSRYANMPKSEQGVLRAMAVFPGQFNLTAVEAVASSGNFKIAPLLDMKFVVPLGNGRFSLNGAARQFVNGIAAQDDTHRTKMKFIAYFMKVMKDLEMDGDMHRVGSVRERAMLGFDEDRDNINYAYDMAKREGKGKERDFLVAGSSIMRFCIGSRERIRNFQDSLEDDITTAFGIMSTNVASEKLKKARILLGLGEGFMDQLALDEAEVPLTQALEIYDAFALPNDSTYTTDLSLTLLLLANLKMEKRDFECANGHLSRALRVLNLSGMGRTTLAVNALANLATISLQSGDLGKAQMLSRELLDVLHVMKYNEMPIYADVLGVAALVNLCLGEVDESAKKFVRALEIIANWGAKDVWGDIPIQHCLDLDVWLMEGFAQTLFAQNKLESAQNMMEMAHGARVARGLPIEDSDGLDDMLSKGINRLMSNRHIY